MREVIGGRLQKGKIINKKIRGSPTSRIWPQFFLWEGRHQCGLAPLQMRIKCAGETIGGRQQKRLNNN
jgi:hypothetical protein